MAKKGRGRAKRNCAPCMCKDWRGEGNSLNRRNSNDVKMLVKSEQDLKEAEIELQEHA